MIPKEVQVCSLLCALQGICCLAESGRIMNAYMQQAQNPPLAGGAYSFVTHMFAAIPTLIFFLLSMLFFVIAFVIILDIGWARTGGLVVSVLGILLGLPYAMMTSKNMVALFVVILSLIDFCLLAVLDIESYLSSLKSETAIYPPSDRHERLYGMLLSTYTQFYGSKSRQVIEDKISSLLKQGLSRKESIRKLSEKEGLIEKE